jgi:hypothetical protein
VVKIVKIATAQGKINSTRYIKLACQIQNLNVKKILHFSSPNKASNYWSFVDCVFTLHYCHLYNSLYAGLNPFNN